MKRRVLWEPVSDEGTQWLAWYDGINRGYVARVYGGKYVARIQGRRARKYTRTLREAGREVVAFVNGVAPKSIPERVQP